METIIDATNLSAPPNRKLLIRVFGVGGAGGNIVDHLAVSGPAGAEFVALNTDAQALGRVTTARAIPLGAQLTRGLGAGGDPDVGRAAAEADAERLRPLFAGADIVFLATGLGGGTGTGATPVLARIARESGALALSIATLPFDWEGPRRRQQAVHGLQELRRAADAVICIPNQSVLRLTDENTRVVETLQITNELLADGIRGISRLLTRPGIINVDFADLCTVLRGRQAESAFACVEARGPGRANEVVDRLLVSPFLEGGQILSDAEAVLVSLTGGQDLTMNEVNRVMEQISRQCERAHIIVGAAIDDEFNDRLGVLVVASRFGAPEPEKSPAGRTVISAGTSTSPDNGGMAEVDTQFLRAVPTPRPPSRFVAPPPELAQQEKQDLLIRQKGPSGKGRKAGGRPRQELLPLDIISKGRFEKSEPTIHRGEDLDVPTYIRRGVALN